MYSTRHGEPAHPARVPADAHRSRTHSADPKSAKTGKELTGAAPKTTSAGILGGRFNYCHLPKLGVLDLSSFSRFSNQSLAVEPLITFPLRLQIVPRWT
jgi:hypothetical protein